VQLLSFTPQMRYFDLPHTIILPVKTRFCLTSFVAKEIDQSRSFDMESLRHRPTFAAESRPTLPIVFEGNSKRRADPRNLLLPPTVRTCTRAFQTQAMVTRTNWPSCPKIPPPRKQRPNDTCNKGHTPPDDRHHPACHQQHTCTTTRDRSLRAP